MMYYYLMVTGKEDGETITHIVVDNDVETVASKIMSKGTVPEKHVGNPTAWEMGVAYRGELEDTPESFKAAHPEIVAERFEQFYRVTGMGGEAACSFDRPIPVCGWFPVEAFFIPVRNGKRLILSSGEYEHNNKNFWMPE